MWSSLLIRAGLEGHLNAVQADLLAVPEHHEVQGIPRPAEKEGQVIIIVDPVSVQGVDHVPGLEPAVLHTVALQKAVDGGQHETGGLGKRIRISTKPVRKFMKAPAQRMTIFFHPLARPKARGCRSPHPPLHGAVSADGQGTNTVKCLPLLLLPESGPHAHRELIHLHPQQLGGGKMPQLMGGDQHAEDQYRDDNIKKNRTEHRTSKRKSVWTLSHTARAARSASRMSSRVGRWTTGT